MNNGRYPNNSEGVADYINIIQNEERNERIFEKNSYEEKLFFGNFFHTIYEDKS